MSEMRGRSCVDHARYHGAFLRISHDSAGSVGMDDATTTTRRAVGHHVQYNAQYNAVQVPKVPNAV